MIRQDRKGAVLRVTIDRPDRRNALRSRDLQQLADVIVDAERPVIYLTGADGAFCAGADLDEIGQLDRSSAEAFARLGQTLARTIESADAIVVAGIEGPARGGGVELALACNIRIASPAATFAESGIELGLFGAWGGTHRLPNIVGDGNAMDLAASGRIIDAEEARRIGLVSRVVDRPFEVAIEIAQHDEQALFAIKRLLRMDRSARTVEAAERSAFARLIEARHSD